ncbi:MAG: SOS response-associated peptidase [Polyangiaceae bacterium]
MCGRFTLRDPRRALREFSILEKAPALEPRFNIAPSQGVWAVRIADASMRLELDLLQWGIAGKASPKSSAVVMVRSEGLAKRPPYGEAFRKRRCLLVADGFYEWRKAGRQSFPYYFARSNGEPFTIAAIWEPGALGAKENGKLDTCALITRRALPPVDAVHHRMPVLLATAHREKWLDPDFDDTDSLQAMLADPPEFSLLARPVSTRVNSPANDDDGCTAPVEESEQHGEQFELFGSRSA